MSSGSVVTVQHNDITLSERNQDVEFVVWMNPILFRSRANAVPFTTVWLVVEDKPLIFSSTCSPIFFEESFDLEW